MASADDKPLEERTFTVDEVGDLIRRASAEAAARPRPVADHDRLTWSEVKTIAEEVGVGETALVATVNADAATKQAEQEKAAAATAEPAAPAPAPAAAPAPVTSGSKRWIVRRGLETALTIAIAGAADLFIGAHGVLFGVVALVYGVGFTRRLIRTYFPEPATHPALPGGDDPTDWRAMKRAAHHARRAERHARKAERHARRAERYRL